MRLSFFLFVAVAMLPGCAGQPATPTAPLSPSPAASILPANYAGAWRITFTREECLSRHCYSTLGQPAQVDLRLTQIGDRVAGIIPGSTGFTNVAGTVTPDGRLSLSGQSTPGGFSTPGLTVDRLELELDGANGVRGYVRLTSWYEGDQSAYNGGAGGSITAGSRAPLAGTFDGQWMGYFHTVSCTPGPYCLLERKGELELTLEQRGPGLNGVLKVRFTSSAPVTGTTEGSHAQLTGDGPDFEVHEFRVTRDAVGRLTGSLMLRSRASAMELTLVRVGRLSDEP